MVSLWLVSINTHILSFSKTSPRSSPFGGAFNCLVVDTFGTLCFSARFLGLLIESSCVDLVHAGSFLLGSLEEDNTLRCIRRGRAGLCGRCGGVIERPSESESPPKMKSDSSSSLGSEISSLSESSVSDPDSSDDSMLSFFFWAIFESNAFFSPRVINRRVLFGSSGGLDSACLALTGRRSSSSPAMAPPASSLPDWAHDSCLELGARLPVPLSTSEPSPGVRSEPFVGC